jgi:hypothetical protein
MTSLSEAFQPTEEHPWEQTENQQTYTYQVTQRINPTPQRHILGLVGGNEVSLIKGNMVDLESDLRGINIPNTFCPQRQYQPPTPTATTIERANRKTQQSIDIRSQHLPTYQMWAYPGMPAPTPLKSEVCANPEKY